MTYWEPLITAFCLITLLGVLRLRRGKGSGLAVTGIACIFLISWPPVDWLFSRPLEMWYRVGPFPSAPVQAIVVFSSAIDPPSRAHPFAIPDSQTYGRCEFASWLYRNWASVPVLACGGGGSRRHESYAKGMKELLQRAGVPEAMIWIEEHSRSTHENAMFASQILREHGISNVALVVEAASMPRAEACLQKAGIQVTPAPSEFRVFGPLREEIMPSWTAIRRNEIVLHEVVGLGWYWLRGWI